MDQSLITADKWPYLPTLLRLALALAAGVFVGLERERRQKAGLRTFAFASLIGCLGAFLGDAYALVGLGFLCLIVFLMNWRQLRRNQSLEMTTSAALLVTGMAGVLFGKGHTFTPVAVTVITTALLAWKQPLSGFVLILKEAELRSAILLAIISFVVYPVLPDQAIDPWGLVELRSTWATVILIAAFGFVNYLLWRAYGKKGTEITGFLGGLVNSTVAVAELASRVREVGARLINTAYRGVMLATAAMVLRNTVILGLLAPMVLQSSLLPLCLMLVSTGALAWVRLAHSEPPDGGEMTLIQLESPFSFRSALKFGLLFLILQIAGTLGQRFLGIYGFYAVSIAGGLFSSASAVASAASLAIHHELRPDIAASGAVLASTTSALVNLPLIARVGKQKRLTVALLKALIVVSLLGIAGAIAQNYFRGALGH